MRIVIDQMAAERCGSSFEGAVFHRGGNVSEGRPRGMASLNQLHNMGRLLASFPGGIFLPIKAASTYDRAQPALEKFNYVVPARSVIHQDTFSWSQMACIAMVKKGNTFLNGVRCLVG